MSGLSGKRITLVKGGPGSERPVSLASAAGVGKALRNLGAVVTEVDYTSGELEIPADTEIVFNIIHGTFGEDGQLQEILDRRGIAYTGEGAAGSRLAFDKIESKAKFITAGIPTAGFEVIQVGERPSLPVPLVIKAPREGSSVGVYIIKKPEELESALADAARYDQRLLVEQFIAGRELTVGILGDQALPIIEICPKEGFYDFKNKYPFLNPQGGATHFCPAAIEEGLTRRIQELALAAHRSLGLEVYSRVDFLLPESGEPFVLEINTIPGMTEASLLPEAAAAAGISYEQLCERVVELSLGKQKTA